jgi:hypothetical protein
VAGLAFVRCTNVWIADVDGSSPRRLLALPGLASPAFSPDGRTIAAFAVSGADLDLWLVAADGSQAEPAGSLEVHGTDVAMTPAGLTWSPDGDELAFSLSPDGVSGWSVWTLDLERGSFERVGAGGPNPFYVGRALLVAGPGTGGEVRVLEGRGRWYAKRLSGPNAERSVSVAPGWWKDGWRSDTASVAIRHDGVAVVELRRGPSARRARTFVAPPGFAVDSTGRPAVVQGGSVVVPLVDGEGGRDLGLLDPARGAWATLDYAWDPVVSPVPPAAGPIQATRATSLVRHLLWQSQRHPEDAALLLRGGRLDAVTAIGRYGFALDRPRPAGDAWRVAATVFGSTPHGFAGRRVVFAVAPVDGRLAVRVAAVGRLRRVRTIDDAFRFLRSMVTVPTAALPELPSGTKLAKQPLSAWTWGGVTVGQLDLRVPTDDGLGWLTFHFGDGGFGCVDPVPTTLATGTPAIATDPELGDAVATQVAWPVEDRRATSGPFGISGTLPRQTVLAMAAEMDRLRLAAS